MKAPGGCLSREILKKKTQLNPRLRLPSSESSCVDDYKWVLLLSTSGHLLRLLCLSSLPREILLILQDQTSVFSLPINQFLNPRRGNELRHWSDDSCNPVGLSPVSWPSRKLEISEAMVVQIR